MSTTTYPADEKRVADVERGMSCDAIVPIPPGQSLIVGDAVLFAVPQHRTGARAGFAGWGDSVLVSLTSVVPMNEADPATGHALFRVCWDPPGQQSAGASAVRRAR